MTQLTLIRHGETDWNINRRFQGSSDNPLNLRGQQQAACLYPRLLDEQFDAIYISDLKRVQQTAQAALGARFSQVRLDKRLREIDFGGFEGLTYAEIRAQYPDELAQWEADRNSGVMDIERYDDVLHRVKGFYDEIRAAYPEDDQHILIIAHGGMIGIILSLALGAPVDKWWQLRMENTAIAQIDLYDNGSILKKFNDFYHLQPELMR